MAPRRRNPKDLGQHRQHLAQLIDTAIAQGQHAPKSGEAYESRPWTNLSFGLAVGANESTVRGWRDAITPHVPPNIVPILRVLYGNASEFAEPRDAMRQAWYRAKGVEPPEPPPPPPRDMSGPRPFADAAEIIDLAMSQPPPTNGSLLTVPFTFRVHPDRDCDIDGVRVALGVKSVLVVVESEHWQPQSGSVFRGASHPNTGNTAVPGAALFTGPKENEAWIDGKPLGDQPQVVMERMQDGDGPVTMTARVMRDAFEVVPLRPQGDNRPSEQIAATKKHVLDAIFADAYEQDARKRLVVARTRIGGPRTG
jgi:hypothetical protein